MTARSLPATKTTKMRRTEVLKTPIRATYSTKGNYWKEREPAHLPSSPEKKGKGPGRRSHGGSIHSQGDSWLSGRMQLQRQQPDTDAAGARSALTDIVAPVLVQPSVRGGPSFGGDAPPPSPAPTRIYKRAMARTAVP